MQILLILISGNFVYPVAYVLKRECYEKNCTKFNHDFWLLLSELAVGIGIFPLRPEEN